MTINYNNHLITADNVTTDTLDIGSRYYEHSTSVSISSNTLTLDLNNGNLFLCSLNSNITTLTISNAPSTSGQAMTFALVFTADGTARSVTWPASVKWPGGTGPTLSSTSGCIDVLHFNSTDNGTSWLGIISRIGCGSEPPPPPPPPAPPPPAPPPPAPPPPAPPPCWVAREIYGIHNPDWVVFADWMLNDSPSIIRENYIKYGERIAEYIKNKPIVKSAMKIPMDYIVRKRKNRKRN